MESFANWDIANDDITVAKNEYLDQYLEGYNVDMDDLFNQTLIGLQDLDVPTGFVDELQSQNPTSFHTTNSINVYSHSAKHSRKVSGTAIFGFDNHTRELSLDLAPSGLRSNSKSISISPVQLLKSVSPPKGPPLKMQSLPLQKSNYKPDTIYEDTTEPQAPQTVGAKPKTNPDYITTASPKSYKFPPSPSPRESALAARGSPSKPSTVNSYSAKYLQELGRLNSDTKEPVYVDDIGPLLEEDTTPKQSSEPSTLFNNQLKYVPLTVQEPLMLQKPPQTQHAPSKLYLPPPPPAITTTLPLSSIESQAYEKSSPTHLNSSPIHATDANLFYNPQFFSDDSNFFENEGYSSPVPQSLSSSPIKGNYYSSPLKQVPINNDYDETVDADNTLAQMTPLKPTFPITPSRNKVILEWSPIVSPNHKSNQDVKLAIKQSVIKKRIKKTSLLPPGELDKYWQGPDHDKFFICTYKGCGKKFTRRYNVRSHIQTHLSDRPFSCVYCPKKFVRQHDLNRHVKGHLEARPSKCPCGKEFARIDAMKKHRMRNICSGGITSNENDNYQDIDKDTFSYSNSLTNNILRDIENIGSF